MNFGWFGRNLGAPMIQNFVAGAFGIALFAAVNSSGELITGCASSIKETLAQGEGKLDEGDIAQARRLAADALVVSPHCIAANEFAASVSRRLMVEAIAHNHADLAEQYRLICYTKALGAVSIIGKSARTENLLTACAAVSSGG